MITSILYVEIDGNEVIIRMGDELGHLSSITMTLPALTTLARHATMQLQEISDANNLDGR